MLLGGGQEISAEVLDEIEELIMTSLDSRVVVYTAMDYIQALLFIANNSLSFSDIKEELPKYIVFCSSHEEIRRYPQSTIGLACLMTVLKMLNYI
jgi:hypothetical protein